MIAVLTIAEWAGRVMVSDISYGPGCVSFGNLEAICAMMEHHPEICLCWTNFCFAQLHNSGLGNPVYLTLLVKVELNLLDAECLIISAFILMKMRILGSRHMKNSVAINVQHDKGGRGKEWQKF